MKWLTNIVHNLDFCLFLSFITKGMNCFCEPFLFFITGLLCISGISYYGLSSLFFVLKYVCIQKGTLGPFFFLRQMVAPISSLWTDSGKRSCTWFFSHLVLLRSQIQYLSLQNREVNLLWWVWQQCSLPCWFEVFVENSTDRLSWNQILIYKLPGCIVLSLKIIKK
jgi:hypothetical protein